MTFPVLFYLWCILMLEMALLWFLSSEYVALKPCWDVDDETGELTYILSRYQSDLWSVFYISGFIFLGTALPLFVLIVAALGFLLVSAISDWRTTYINSLYLYIILAAGISIGVRTGHIPSVIFAAVIMIAFAWINDENDDFGSADMIVIVAALSAFGICAMPLFLIISCTLGIVHKLILWAVKKDDMKNHMITFVPAMFAGAVITIFIDAAYGHLYTFTLRELIDLFA